MLEVIVTSVDEALEAEKHGAHRLEVVKDIEVAGLTPDRSIIKNMIEVVKIPLVIMIRPHHHGFQYSNEDIQKMIGDIHYFNNFRIESFVLGVLNEENEIDTNKLKLLVDACGDTHTVAPD